MFNLATLRQLIPWCFTALRFCYVTILRCGTKAEACCITMSRQNTPEGTTSHAN